MKTLRYTTNTLFCLALTLSAGAFARDLPRVESGREGGGIPPKPNATHIVLTQDLNSGVLTTQEWKDVNAIIAAQAAKTDICVKAYFETSRGGELKVVGATPDELLQTASDINVAQPADVQFNYALHYRFCEKFVRESGIKDDTAKMLTTTLETYGISNPRHGLPAFKAESLNCMGERFLGEGQAPVCFLYAADDKVSRVDETLSAQLYNYLKDRGDIAPLHVDAYFVRNLSCDAMEIFNPMGIRMFCSMEAPLIAK